MFERFISKVDLSNDCWVWIASTNGVGYGKMSIGSGKLEDAHRVSYKLFKGDIPQGDVVMHSCDNRLCVNPEHLKIGTTRDNILDMINKGRRRDAASYTKQSGENNSKSKLTFKKAEAIRQKYSSGLYTYSALAKEYGVSIQSIYRVIKKNKYITV